MLRGKRKSRRKEGWKEEGERGIPEKQETVRSPEMREGKAGIRLEGLIREMREEARDR